MFQVSHPIPTGVPVCRPGHRPQLVETRGAPDGHRVGTPCPPQWHIECFQCSCASVPSPSRAITELRWSTPEDRIPLSQLRQARERAAALPAAA